jgi:hypothetical protein
MASKHNHYWGFHILLSHSEACRATNRTLVTSVTGLSSIIAGFFTSGIGTAIVSAIATALYAAMDYMRDKNEHSGKKGIQLQFVWPAIYVGCSRRGKGVSPC